MKWARLVTPDEAPSGAPLPPDVVNCGKRDSLSSLPLGSCKSD